MRVPFALRRFIERLAPWYDPDEALRRRQETQAARKRAIAARIALELTQDLPRRYQRHDDILRR